MVSTGLKHNKNYAKTEILASKSTFHSVHAFMWSMDNTQKWHSNTFRSSFKMTKKILVCNIFYHILFAVSLGNKASKMS